MNEHQWKLQEFILNVFYIAIYKILHIQKKEKEDKIMT